MTQLTANDFVVNGNGDGYIEGQGEDREGNGLKISFQILKVTIDYNFASVVRAGVCTGCRCSELIWMCSKLIFGPNNLRSAVLGYESTDSIPPQVSRKKSLRPLQGLQASQSVY